MDEAMLVWLLLVVCVSSVWNTVIIGQRQYCSGMEESFKIECEDENALVLVINATYSYRSSLFVANHDLNECSNNLRDYFVRTCSGKKSGSCRLQSNNFFGSNLCNSSNALECFNLSYQCIKVIKVQDCRDCENDDTITKLTSPEGYLGSSTTSSDTNCGSGRCPWFIQVLPGQVINVTLLDFTVGERKSGGSGSPSESCLQFAQIKERANPKEVRVCGGKERERNVYLSVSNTLEIRISNLQESRDETFVIHYEAIGCPDVTPPRYSRMKRTGDLCEIDCPGSTPPKQLTLNCQGNQWSGLHELDKMSCPAVVMPPGGGGDIKQSNTENNNSLTSLPTGVLMALLIAVAVIMGVLILTIGFVCLKKHQFDRKSKSDQNVVYGERGKLCSEFEFCQSSVNQQTNVSTGQSVKPRRSSAADLLSPVRDNTYAADARAIEMRPLPSIPPDANGVPGGGTWQRNPNRVIVQLHRTDSGRETVNLIQPFQTMAVRGGAGGGHPLLPCSCGGTLRPFPTVTSSNRHLEDNHVYFSLDPEVKVDEPAAIGFYPTVEQRGNTNSRTIPKDRHQHLQMGRQPPHHQPLPTDHAGLQLSIPKADAENRSFTSAAEHLPLIDEPGYRLLNGEAGYRPFATNAEHHPLTMGEKLHDDATKNNSNQRR